MTAGMTKHGELIEIWSGVAHFCGEQQLLETFLEDCFKSSESLLNCANALN